MMKKMVMVLMLLCLLSACQEKEEVIEPTGTGGEDETVDGISFEGRDLFLDLDVSDGTGFEWFPIYKSDNVEKKESSYHVDREDPASTGGRADVGFAFRVNDAEDALLIMKLARPWEPDGSYEAYFIRMKDGSIDSVEDRSASVYGDMQFIFESFGEDWIGVNIPKDWEYEIVEDEEAYGFALRPSGEKECMQLLRYPSFVCDKEIRKIMIGEKGFDMGLDEEGKAVCLAGEDIVCLFEDAGWSKDRFYQIIEIVDNVRFE